MIASAIKLAQYGLWVAIAALVVGLGTPFRRGEIPQVELVELEPIRRAQAAFGRYTVIGTKNLFRVPEGAVAAAPIEEVIVESKLNFKIKGTIAGPGDRATAIVENARGQRQVVGVNSILEGNVRVERIEAGRIIVKNRDELEQITMAEAEAPASLALLQSGKRSVAKITVIPPAPPAYIAVASPELARKLAALLARPDTPAGNARPAAPRSIAERELPSENSSFPRTLNSPRVASATGFSATAQRIAPPVSGLGASSRFQAVAGGDELRRLLRKVDLRDGEEILAVNDIPVEATERLPELLRSLLRSDRASVQIAVDSNSVRIIEVALR